MVGRRLALASLLLLGAAPAAAHEPIVLDARRATPGLRLELIELPPATTPARVGYRLRATGLPRGLVFDVWAKDFGHTFHEVAAGFRMDGSGALVSSEPDGAARPRRLDEMVFEPGPSPQGAVWEVALVSADRTVSAFARAIPRPITARDGPCTVALELVSRRGDRFLASGAGFAPGDDVTIESGHSGRVMQKRQRVSADGRLPPDVIAHGATGTDRNARYAVKGRSCEVAVEYTWGEATLSRH